MLQKQRDYDRFRLRFPLMIGAALLVVLTQTLRVLAAEPATTPFQQTWDRPDRPVAAGQVSRTWMWGPEAFTGALSEPYSEAPGGQRTVQYFDKSRMEITDPDADSGADWYVTNGLLVVELVSGQMQVGNDSFDARQPAIVNVAGDTDDPSGPTYMTMGRILHEPARDEGVAIIDRLDRSGKIEADESLVPRGVTAAYYVPETDHTVAGPFWTFMQSEGMIYRDGQYLEDRLFPNPFYATGYPVAEAYWAEVKVGGLYRDVLMQCFERRCLTYTPDNPTGWQVEAGNVGRHYYAWRYAETEPEHPAPEQPTPEQPQPETLPASVVDYTYGGAIGGPGDSLNDFIGLSGVTMSPDSHIVVVDKATERVQGFSTGGVWTFGFGADPNNDLPIETPQDVEVAADGTIWVLDTGGSRLVGFDREGNVTGVIGDSVGPAYGQFQNPTSFTIGPDGYFYIADTGNYRVQVLDDQGTFVRGWGGRGTAAGKFRLPTGIAVDEDGNVFVADQDAHRIQKFSADGTVRWSIGTRGAGDDQFKYPNDLVIDATGTIYVADSGNGRIQVLTTGGGFIRSIGVQGAGPGQMVYPADVATDAEGNIYAADLESEFIHKFTASGDFVMRWSGDEQASLDMPGGGDIDEHGLLYVTDREAARVQIYDRDGLYIDSWAADFTLPLDIAVHGDHAYLLDNLRVVKLTLDGEVVATWPLNDADRPLLYAAGSIDVDGDGNVYVAVVATNQIQKFTADGEFVTAWGEPGVDDGEFAGLAGVAAHDGEVYVLDTEPGRVQVFDTAGNFLRGWLEPASMNTLTGIDVDRDGYVYISGEGANEFLEKRTPDGEIVATLSAVDAPVPGGVVQATGVTVWDQDEVYVLSRSAATVLQFVEGVPDNG